MASYLPKKTFDFRCSLVFFFGVRSQVIIPAHLCSGRLPGKVLLSLAGKTLLQRVWDIAKVADFQAEPIIATDSDKIAECARAFGAKVVITSSNHRCGSDRVAEVAKSLSADLFINLQADEVMLDPKLLQVLQGLFTDPAVEMATAVVPMNAREQIEDPSVVKAVLDDNSNVLYFSRSPIPYFSNVNQNGDAMPMWYGHLGVYAYRPKLLQKVYSRPRSELEEAENLEQLRALQAGYSIRAAVFKNEHFGINTPEDFEKAKEVFRRIR
jgi:3-deoxy-manno-octulosonate cytidylyltransferase (CMP-KDO synthetase)